MRLAEQDRLVLVAIDARNGEVLEVRRRELDHPVARHELQRLYRLLSAGNSDPVRAIELASAEVPAARPSGFLVEAGDEGLEYRVLLRNGDVFRAVELNPDGQVTRVEEVASEDPFWGNGEIIDFDFETDTAGLLPDDWRIAGTNPDGPLATWKVLADPPRPLRPTCWR